MEQSDYLHAAELLSVEPAAIQAVAEVEGGGIGMLNGKPIIRLEAHVFWRELKRRGIQPEKHLLGNGDILSIKWNPELVPNGQAARWAQLERAKQIDETAALRSASWGKFQILGNNHQACGCDTVQEFVERMSKGEGGQLLLFCAFIKSTGLIYPLRHKEWAKFAEGYNGAGYARNAYDRKLANAYKKYSSA